MSDQSIGEIIKEVMRLRMGMPDRLEGWNFETEPEPELLQVLGNERYKLRIRQIWFPHSLRQSVVYHHQVVFDKEVSLENKPYNVHCYVPGPWEEEVRKIHSQYTKHEKCG